MGKKVVALLLCLSMLLSLVPMTAFAEEITEAGNQVTESDGTALSGESEAEQLEVEIQKALEEVRLPGSEQEDSVLKSEAPDGTTEQQAVTESVPKSVENPVNDIAEEATGTDNAPVATLEAIQPMAAANVKPMIAAGYFHTAALKSDGSVWCWGNNASAGQLGDGTTTERYTPVQVKNLSGVTAIAAGMYHTAALKSDGTVWCWGGNGSGQLGDETTADRYTPIQVKGLSGVTAIAAGAHHTVAVKSGGSVWCGVIMEVASWETEPRQSGLPR